MARDDEEWKRRRQREDEREQEEAHEALNKKKGSTESLSGKGDPLITTGVSLETLLQKGESMIDQVDHLYGMYFAGVEKIPPIQTRNVLEQLMVTLQNAAKSTPAQKFKYSGLLSRFQSYRERWDKKLKEREKTSRF